MSETFRQALRSGRILNVAHRGASAYAPENTVEAFELALEQGAEVLELDVHLTRDEEVAVIHDARLERTTDGQGDVERMSLAELSSLDAGAWFGEAWRGARVPTLQLVLERFAVRAFLDIEIKSGIRLVSFGPLADASTPSRSPLASTLLALPYLPRLLIREDNVASRALARQTLEVVRRAAALDRVLISCFGPAALRWVRSAAPEVPTHWSLVSTRIGWECALAARAGFDIVSPQDYAATAENVARAHAAGLLVHIYTRRDEEAMAALVRMGVDAIKTDRPDRLRAVLSRLPSLR